LATEVVDVVAGRLPWVLAGLDGVLLGGQAEGVPAHRVQHRVPLQTTIPSHDIRGGVALHMSDVQAGPGGIGEHVQDVVGRVGILGVDLEGLVLLPVVLPLLFDLFVAILGHIGVVVSNGGNPGDCTPRGR